MPEPKLSPARYEPSDMPARSVLIAFPVTLLALLAFVLLARWIYPHAAVDRRLPSGVPDYPQPRLQADPKHDMQRFLAAERARLASSGWDDQAAGAGHISIDEAMRRIASDGIKDWPK